MGESEWLCVMELEVCSNSIIILSYDIPSIHFIKYELQNTHTETLTDVRLKAS
jgi:hypothetical protein